MTTMSDPTDATAAWVEVASGAANVSVFREKTDAIYVYVGASSPGAGTIKGVCLAGENRQFSASNLVAADKVFVRARMASAYTVMKS